MDSTNRGPHSATVCTVEKNLHRSRPVQLKPSLSKGQRTFSVLTSLMICCSSTDLRLPPPLGHCIPSSSILSHKRKESSLKANMVLFPIPKKSNKGSIFLLHLSHSLLFFIAKLLDRVVYMHCVEFSSSLY